MVDLSLRVSQQFDGVSPSLSAEVEVRTAPQRAAAIDGCALKGGHRTKGKIDCHTEQRRMNSVGMKRYH